MDIKRPDLTSKKRRRMLVAIGTGACVTILLIVLAFAIGPAVPRVARDAVWSGEVKHGEMLREVRAAGSLGPRSTRWIATETDARVDRILIKAGAQVTADTVVMELSNPALQEKLAHAESDLRVAEANVSSRRAELQSRLLELRFKVADVEAAYEVAQMKVESERKLAEREIISRLAFQQDITIADSYKKKLAIQRALVKLEDRNIDIQLAGELAKVDQLRASRDLPLHQIDALKVRSGINGVLQQVLVQEGQRLVAGANLARVARPDELIAQLRVPEAEARDVAVGQKAALKINGETVPGRVARVDPAVSNNTVLVDVEPLRALSSGARPDLSVDAQIELERLHDVLYVSRPAGSQPMSMSRVFRVDANGDGARAVQVRFGRASVNQIVVESGLREGDVVVLSDTSSWENTDHIGFK